MESSLQVLIDARERLKYLETILFHRASVDHGVYLNLGCGKRILDGFINIDRYCLSDPRILRADIYRLPLGNETADALFSAHSLEHLPIRRASLALQDWYRVMKPGATLLLSMPDLDMIMRTLLQENLSARGRRWFLYTLFGYQTDMEFSRDTDDPPLDYGQFHASGYSIRTIVDEMRTVGYRIEEAANYEGYGTPGLYVVASK